GGRNRRKDAIAEALHLAVGIEARPPHLVAVVVEVPAARRRSREAHDRPRVVVRRDGGLLPAAAEEYQGEAEERGSDAGSGQAATPKVGGAPARGACEGGCREKDAGRWSRGQGASR